MTEVLDILYSAALEKVHVEQPAYISSRISHALGNACMVRIKINAVGKIATMTAKASARPVYASFYQ